MDKIHIKLIAMVLALTLSVSVLIMSSYAWMVLSSNPAATGIQVVIGGGNTILIAPNVEETVDGKTYNIPGYFSDKMNFGMQESYRYLSEIGGLTPVSTSNGIDWFLSGGQVDSELANANVPRFVYDENGEISGDNGRIIGEGHYIYLDFWVVAPSGEYELRVSTGEKDSAGGSFVVDLLEPKISVDENGFSSGELLKPEGSAAAAIRLGFLANPVGLTDDTMLVYTQSKYYDDRFTALRGLYQEPDSGTPYLDSDRFTIFEPNGDYHPLDEELDGSYVQTKPMMLVDGKAEPNENIWGNLSVQLRSDWAEDGLIGEKFNTAVIGNKDWSEKTPAEVSALFYGRVLQGQLSPYVMKGDFITYSNSGETSLKALAEANEGKVSAAQISGIRKTGATEDVYIIELEKNIPQRVRMFIWLEGQDIDCPASANSARFAVNLELAGGSKE